MASEYEVTFLKRGVLVHWHLKYIRTIGSTAEYAVFSGDTQSTSMSRCGEQWWVGYSIPKGSLEDAILAYGEAISLEIQDLSVKEVPMSPVIRCSLPKY